MEEVQSIIGKPGYNSSNRKKTKLTPAMLEKIEHYLEENRHKRETGKAKQQGHLLTTEGNVNHYGFIEAFIEDLGTFYNIKEIAFDRWGSGADDPEFREAWLYGGSLRSRL